MDFNYLTFNKLLGDQNFISAVNYSVGQIIMALLLTFVFSLYIYIIYKKTYQGAVFSKNFGLTLIVVSLVAAMIVMAISGNLALSLGMVGALSIVRFRSAIKDPRDIAYLFWAISNGIVTGVLIYKLAIVANILIGGIILIFSKKIVQHKSFLLVITGNDIDRKSLKDILDTHCSYVQLRLEKNVKDKEEMHIEIKLKGKTFGCGGLITSLRKTIPTIEHVTAVSEEGTIG